VKRRIGIEQPAFHLLLAQHLTSISFLYESPQKKKSWTLQPADLEHILKSFPPKAPAVEKTGKKRDNITVPGRKQLNASLPQAIDAINIIPHYPNPNTLACKHTNQIIDCYKEYKNT